MRGRGHRRGNGWAFVVDVDIDPVTGMRRQRTKGGFGTRHGGRGRPVRGPHLGRRGQLRVALDLEVGEFLRQWREAMRAQVRESTWYGYRIAVDRLVEQLGEVRL